MQGIKVEGIILKRRNLGEADRIITVFTRFLGKITILAKGVRRITSKRAGNVELLNRVSMYLHQAKSFLILTEAISIQTYQKIKEDLLLSTYAYHLIEIVDKMTAENQENRIIYENLVEVLKRLEQSPRQILIRAFEVKILSNLGFTTFQEHLHTGVSQINLGEVSENIKNLLKKLEVLSWDEVIKLKVSKKEALELESILRYHLERVMEGSLKSRQFLKKM